MRNLTNVCFFLEHITQSVVKSHIETSKHSTEELKRMAWTLYNPEETRSNQTKVFETCHFHWCMIVKSHTDPENSHHLCYRILEIHLTNMFVCFFYANK